MRRVLLAGALVLLAAGCGGTKTVTVTETDSVTTTVTVTTGQSSTSAAPCAAAALTGTFAGIPGSAGAGQISYRLRLTNGSTTACFVSGLPNVQLVDQQGVELPTDVSPAHPGTATAVKVVLQPGAAAASEARFSPDIPGGSEPTDAPCEKKAYTLRVTIGGARQDVPVDPPTPVCERGSLALSNFTAAG